jgi:hypothetical protein
MGDGAPSVPVEADIPREMLAADAIVLGRRTTRRGNWRLAVENGYDQGHVAMLHRYGALWTAFNKLPAWVRTPGGGVQRGPWLGRSPTIEGSVAGYGGEFPGLGTWPRRRPWHYKLAPARTSVRLPGTLQVRFRHYTYYVWYFPLDAKRHHYFQLMVKQGDALTRGRFLAEYWLHRRWLNTQFTNQDAMVIAMMTMEGPERLYRPDASITAWRRLCEHARGAEPDTAANGSEPETASYAAKWRKAQV